MAPLLIPGIVHLEAKPAQLASLLAAALDRDLLKKGSYDALLHYFTAYEPVVEQVEVRIAASPEQLFPELHIPFRLFCMTIHAQQWLGFVPELGLQSAGVSREDLLNNMQENIRLEFIRSRRLQSVPALIEAQWYEETTMHVLPVMAPVYSLAEIEEFTRAETEAILPDIAQPLVYTENAVFGLEKEAEQILTAMQGAHKSSVLVVGASGTGKTALIREVTRSLAHNSDPPLMIWEMSAAQLLHKLSALGSWEEYLGLICRELRKTGAILYLSNFAEMFEVGQYAGNNQSMADSLRDYLNREEILVLSECTPEQVAQIELRAPGYLSLFTVVQIAEKSPEQLHEIVRLRTLQLAEQSGSHIEESAIAESLRLQRWFTPYSGLPGKTIRFLQGILTETEKGDIRIVEEADIYHRFCQETGLPAFMIDPAIPLDYAEMKAFFQRNIYGQEAAIGTVLDLLVSIKAAVIRRGKPLASLLFAGPTGVGKTEMAKVLAHFLFGNRSRMIRFDMSEYADMHGILRLTGDFSAGEGLLTSIVRQNPFSVILFDELEKVHPAFYDLLLQILGEGRLTDARGQIADFCSTIIIMTSNIGAREYQTEGIGFTDYGDKKAEAISHFVRAVQDHFRPELFNRLDRIIPFAPLEREVIRRIVDREIDLFLVREGLRARPVTLHLQPEVRTWLAEKGYHPRYGARHLQRALQEQLAAPLARQLNRFRFQDQLTIDIGIEGQEIRLDIVPDKSPLPIHRQIEGAEEQTVAQFAEALTAMRRRAVRIQKGQVYRELLSQFDQLERSLNREKRKGKEDHFWKNPENKRRYAAYRELIETFDQAIREIEETELAGLRLIGGMPVDVQALVAATGNWSARFSRITGEMLRLLYPDFNQCTLALFGNPQYLFSLAKLYFTVAQKHKLKTDARTIWFNTVENRYEQAEYPMRQRDATYILCGMKIDFSGELVFLRFQGEDGFHSFQGLEKLTHRYFIAVEKGLVSNLEVPDDVHRKSFFEAKKIRRFYHVRGDIKDVTYGIHIAEGEIAESLDEILALSYFNQVEMYLTQ